MTQHIPECFKRKMYIDGILANALLQPVVHFGDYVKIKKEQEHQRYSCATIIKMNKNPGGAA